MLYQLDLCGLDAAAVTRLYWDHLGVAAERDEFANELVVGCAKAQEQLDAKIRSVSKHWRLERMARVDRNIIRLATFELMHLPEIPRRVTLNEAVELAKRFGTGESSAFVNGVLDRIATAVGRTPED